MAIWSTAAEIGRRYVVSEDSLLAFGQRGNLPMRRLQTGETFFDEAAVARLFRARAASGEYRVSRSANAKNLGVLGVTKLGKAPPRQPRASSRDNHAHRRARHAS